MTPEEELERAARADQILRDELFKESVRAVESSLIEGIKRSAFKDSEMREKLCQQLVALEAVVGQLRTHMETGKLAEETLRRRKQSR